MHQVDVNRQVTKLKSKLRELVEKNNQLKRKVKKSSMEKQEMREKIQEMQRHDAGEDDGEEMARELEG